MNLTTEQIEQILDGAPDGEGSEQALIVEGNAYFTRLNGSSLLEYLDTHKVWIKCDSFEDVEHIHSLSDLREILALRHEVERLSSFIKRYRYNIKGGEAMQNFIDAKVLRPQKEQDDD